MKNPIKNAAIKFRKLREALVLMNSSGYRFLRNFPPGHYYSPIPDYKEIKERDFDVALNLKKIPGIELRETHQLELLESFTKFYRGLPWKDDTDIESLRYRFDNKYFCYGDVITLYSMMRMFRPNRMIEVGSGFTSAAMLDVDELFLEGATKFTFIEPYPDRLRSLVRADDLSRNTLMEKPVQLVDFSEFEKLQNGDILFIDSSHVSKSGSDVNYLILQILPCLKQGVIIHFHDIMWPFEYPKKWLRVGRIWNEAYLLRAFLQHNSSFEILFFNSYLKQHHRKLIREKMPLMLRQPASKSTIGNSSLWIRKV
jgi:hypothetical protein